MQVLAAAGQALQIVGTITAGENAGRVGNYNSQVLNRQANETLRGAQAREQLQRERSGADLATMRAGLSQNGVAPASGSALVGVSQSMRDAELDALTLQYEGVMEARGQRMQADMEKWQGKVSRRQAYISAAGQLASAASSYMGQKQAPAPVESRWVPSGGNRGAYWKS